jgi:serine/threonine-protein kinase
MTSSAPPRGAQLEPGFRLDRYELLCVLAHGGMASVWLARMRGKHGFEKLVAVKTILPAYAAEPQFQEMFLDEARIASGIEHPNVAKILDLGEFADVLYLVMEFVDGDPLQRIHRECEKKDIRIPLGIVLKIMSDTCAGLEAAHALTNTEGQPLGIVHRDISPQNVLVATNGVSKVIDFGIAKARHRATAETSAGTLKGKINYMAPEQARGVEVDRRADVWAVGAVMYYLLTGGPPYAGANQIATLQALLNGDPIAPLPGSIPLPVRTVVLRALQTDVARRFESALEMQIAIDKAAAAARVQTSTGEVAQFLRSLLGPRAEHRKKLIERALSEAQHREEVNSKLSSPTQTDTGSLPKLGDSTRAGLGPQAPETSQPSPPGASPQSLPVLSPPSLPQWNPSPELTPGSLGTVETPSVPLRSSRRFLPLVAAAALILFAGIGLAIFKRAPGPTHAIEPPPTPPPPVAREAATTEAPTTTAKPQTSASAAPGGSWSASAPASAKKVPAKWEPWRPATSAAKPTPTPPSTAPTDAPTKPKDKDEIGF